MVIEQYEVMLDSWDDNTIIVHILANSIMKFIYGEKGLYYFDISSAKLQQVRNTFSFLNTVREDTKQFKSKMCVRHLMQFCCIEK